MGIDWIIIVLLTLTIRMVTTLTLTLTWISMILLTLTVKGGYEEDPELRNLFPMLYSAQHGLQRGTHW